MLKVRVKIWKTYEGFAVERRPCHAVLRSSALPRLGADGERGSGRDAELRHGCRVGLGNPRFHRNQPNPQKCKKKNPKHPK